MDYGLLGIGVALLIVSFLVGVKKQTWLLAGFNEKVFHDKTILSVTVGFGFFFPLGVLMIVNSIVDYKHQGMFFMIVLIMLYASTAVSLYVSQKRNMK